MNYFDSKYTRRKLLHRLGGSAAFAALAPFVPPTEVEAAEGQIKRYCYMMHSIALQERFMRDILPTSTAPESDLRWRGSYSAMNAMVDKMSFYRGLSNMAKKDGVLPGGHRSGFVSTNVGTPVKNNSAGSGSVLGASNAGINGASSIDQWLADKIKEQGFAGLRDLRYGFDFDKNNDPLKSISFSNGKTMLRDGSTRSNFNKVMSFAGKGVDTNKAVFLERRKVLDLVMGDLRRVESKLSELDRQRLNSNLVAVEDAQATVERAINGSGVDCSLPNSLSAEKGTMDDAIDSFTKLTAIAFNCDITRVAGGQYIPYQAGNYKAVKAFNVSELHKPVNSSFHAASHDKFSSVADINRLMPAVAKFRAQNFLDMITELNKFEQPGGGTLLDDCVVHWFNEAPYDHRNWDIPNMIGGGAGHFKMGKQFVVGDLNRMDAENPQNMMLVSIANAMGFNIEQYGAYRKGPIPSRFLA